MTYREKEQFCEHAAEIIKADKRIYEFGADASTLAMLVAQLQLAFRHPENVGVARHKMEILARVLIEQLDPRHGDVYRFLMMGFDPVQKEDGEEFFEEFIDA